MVAEGTSEAKRCKLGHCSAYDEDFCWQIVYQHQVVHVMVQIHTIYWHDHGLFLCTVVSSLAVSSGDSIVSSVHQVGTKVARTSTDLHASCRKNALF